MKQFLSFVYKEFCHILRDSRTVLILLVMPIVQIILFGFAISTDVNNVRLAVYDPSNDDATRRIVERFDANRYFSLVERSAPRNRSRKRSVRTGPTSRWSSRRISNKTCCTAERGTSS